MRAYKTISWITELGSIPNYYHKETLKKIEELWFKRWFWYYIKKVEKSCFL